MGSWLIAQGTLLALLVGGVTPASTMQRFVVHGNGVISIRSTKNRHTFKGRYRTKGRYLPRAISRITRVIGGDHRRPETRISLRFIELLAYLQHQHRGGWITIASGYRNPRFNKRLRDRGGTVAQASLHLYGMAADLRIEGVDSKKLWAFVKEHKLGGAGYYGNPWIHLDTGPARYWTQGTANVRKGKSNLNKRLMLVPEFDRYRGGELLRLRFARMTALPIGMSLPLTLERQQTTGWKRHARIWPGRPPRATCRLFQSVAKMQAGIHWTLPALPAGRYRVTASFQQPRCGPAYDEMPKSLSSRAFEVESAETPAK